MFLTSANCELYLKHALQHSQRTRRRPVLSPAGRYLCRPRGRPSGGPTPDFLAANGGLAVASLQRRRLATCRIRPTFGPQRKLPLLRLLEPRHDADYTAETVRYFCGQKPLGHQPGMGARNRRFLGRLTQRLGRRVNDTSCRMSRCQSLLKAITDAREYASCCVGTERRSAKLRERRIQRPIMHGDSTYSECEMLVRECSG